MSISRPTCEILNEEILIRTIPGALIRRSRVHGHATCNRHMQVLRNRAEQRIRLPVAGVGKGGHDEHPIMVKVGLPEVDRPTRAVVAAVDSVRELRLQGRNDLLASDGVNADRTIHEGFLGANAGCVYS